MNIKLDSVIKQFWEKDGTHHSGLVHVTLWDSTLFTEDEKQRMNAEVEPWARAFSIEGVPSAGSGAVFAGILRDSIVEPTPVIQRHWKQIIGVDLGYKDDMVFTFIAKDVDTGIYYIYKEISYTETDAAICASGVIPSQKGFIPAIIPADGDSERGLGATYRSIFNNAGMKVCKEQARNWKLDSEGKSRDIKGGIVEMRRLMKAGLLKVDPSCKLFLKEFGLYSYDKNGKFLDNNNHAVDAVRYGLMSIDRFGVTEYEHSNSNKNSVDWTQLPTSTF